jgi:hypothetical protein
MRFAESALTLAVDELEVSLMDDERVGSSGGEAVDIIDEVFAKEVNLCVLEAVDI